MNRQRQAELLDQLATIEREIQSHGTEIYRLTLERQRLREALLASGWKSPRPTEE